MQLPDFDQLQEEFEFLRNSDDRGVKGIYRLSSKKPGPTLIVSMLTHGNEPAGLAPLWYFRSNPSLMRELTGGTVLFIANDLEAACRSFECKSADERMDFRYLDLNMNRLPENALDLSDSPLYEIQRFQQIYSHMQEADAAIDIHSTSQDSEPMIVQIGDQGGQLMPGLKMCKVITNVVQVQKGIPVCAFHGGKDRHIPIIEIEAGGHEKANSYQCAIESTLTVLANAGMLPRPESTEVREYEIYNLLGTIFFPSLDYKFVKEFKNFERINKGQILAQGNAEPIISPIDGCSLFAPARGRIHSLQEEAMFLSALPETRTLKYSTDVSL